MTKRETPFWVIDGDLILVLGHDDIDGLLGMNFLSEFNYEVRSAEHRLLVEKIAP